MKIIKLRFKNINSLAGENEINFTDPVFTTSGLFAITGKTGAGKSSILDAITLALYGRTPRVEISGTENPVMTRGERDCFAEITFEVNGSLWKSSWKQEKTKNGNLKSVSRKIANANNDIVAGQLRECDAKIIDIIGLTFAQFTKVVLLAQGSFAAFLQADKNEKGALLEQITGTEIYGEISMMVHKRLDAENEKLRRIDVALQGIRTLSSDELHATEQEISDCTAKKERIDNEIKSTEKSIEWLQKRENLNKQIREENESLPDLEVKTGQAKAEFDKADVDLLNAKSEIKQHEQLFIKVREADTKISLKKNSLMPVLNQIDTLTGQIAQLDKKITETNNRLSRFVSRLSERTEWAQKNKLFEELVTTISAIRKDDELLKKTDNEISRFKQLAEDYKNEYTTKKIAAENAGQALTDKEATLQTKKEELEKYKKKLSEIPGGSDISGLQESKARMADFIDRLKEVISAEESITDVQNDIDQIASNLHAVNDQYHTIETALPNEEQLLGELEVQITLLDELIDMTRVIQSLEEHRHQLQSGKPCPLCGSSEHPYSLGNQPVIGDKESQLTILKDRYKSKSNEMNELKITIAKLNSDKENAYILQGKATVRLNDLIADHSRLCAEILTFDPNFILPAGYTNIEQIRSLLTEKEQIFDSLKELISMVSELDGKIEFIRDTEMPVLNEARESGVEYKRNAESERDLAERDWRNQELILNNSLEVYEKDLKTFRQTLQRYSVQDITALQLCLDAWNENEKEKEQLDKQLTDIKQELALFIKDHANSDQLLQGTLAEKNDIETETAILMNERQKLFGDKSVDVEEGALKNRITDSEIKRDASEKHYNELYIELTKLKTIIQKNEEELIGLNEQQLTDKTLEELEKHLSENRELTNKLSEQIGAGNETLRMNQEHTKIGAEKIKEKEAQQIIANRWKNLDDLIGSSDGKKFRNFAQGLTFEQLVMLANNILKQMSDRYLLKRDGKPNDPFALSVIDRFQNNEERTADNISGGEKFLVSLSMALGLSNMVSNNMRIDTMFVDEGFATLDPDCLDLAFSTLSSLQSEGKLIGVISHITELKERISTHVEVRQKGNGHSIIQITG